MLRKLVPLFAIVGSIGRHLSIGRLTPCRLRERRVAGGDSGEAESLLEPTPDHDNWVPLHDQLHAADSKVLSCANGGSASIVPSPPNEKAAKSPGRPIAVDGQPANIADILAVAEDNRTDKQKAELLGHYRNLDMEFKQRTEALNVAKQPLPVDPKLLQLRDGLTEASRPLPQDAKLERLRRDVELSARQLEKSRLTFAQDLAWALINSPAFLFNH